MPLQEVNKLFNIKSMDNSYVLGMGLLCQVGLDVNLGYPIEVALLDRHEYRVSVANDSTECLESVNIKV